MSSSRSRDGRPEIVDRRPLRCGAPCRRHAQQGRCRQCGLHGDPGAAGRGLVEDAVARTQTRIVFFDMEELGLLGSAEFVRAHRDRPMRAMVNLDVNAFGDAVMIGPRTASNGFALRESACVMCGNRRRVCRVSPHAAKRRHQLSKRRHPGSVDRDCARGCRRTSSGCCSTAARSPACSQDLHPAFCGTIHTAADTSALVDRDAMAQAYRVTVSLVATLSAH